MCIRDSYLEATVNTAAVARHYGVEAFVNMSQMTVSQMSISATTDSPQHKAFDRRDILSTWSAISRPCPS